jgi:hypothetical protein
MLHNKHNKLDTHFTFTCTFIRVLSLDMFRASLAHLQEAYTNAVLCGCRSGLFVESRQQPTTTIAHNHHQTSVCVVPPEDGQVMPETCQDFEP